MHKIIFSNNINIFVPNTLKNMTNYILLEQLNWFEEETNFLSKFILKGNNVIDIGANYGVYTLILSKLIGSKGHIYSFEPCTSTRKFLRKSITENSFKNVTIDNRGVSNSNQKSKLSLNKHSEINHVFHDLDDNNAYEEITLCNLDDCRKFYEWKNIDFIKIDAEGQESNILKGGKEFLNENSPLIQYEVKDKTVFNLNLIKEFKSIGYDTYRLIPGLDILAPWDDIEHDEYILNLFCCKPDKAKKLEKDKLLIRKNSLSFDNRKNFDALYDKLISENNFYDFINTNIPYNNFLTPYWKKTIDFHNEDIQKSIFLYLISHDNKYSHVMRYESIKYSFRLLSQQCAINSGNARLSSLARVSGELGLRSTQVSSLIQLKEYIDEDKNLELSEIFLLPEKYQEQLSVSDWNSEILNWMISNILITIEKKEYYSSFYAQDKTLWRLYLIKSLGFYDAEISRRINLIEKKFKNEETVYNPSTYDQSTTS